MTSIRTANNRRKNKARRRREQPWSSLRFSWMWMQYGPPSKWPRRQPTKSKRKLLAAYRAMFGLVLKHKEASAPYFMLEQMFHSGGIVRDAPDDLPALISINRVSNLRSRYFKPAYIDPVDEEAPDLRISAKQTFTFKPLPIDPNDTKFVELQEIIKKQIASQFERQTHAALLGADYSGVERRLLAHFVEDVSRSRFKAIRDDDDAS